MTGSHNGSESEVRLKYSRVKPLTHGPSRRLVVTTRRDGRALFVGSRRDGRQETAVSATPLLTAVVMAPLSHDLS